jgi:hypothetical protein
VGPDATDAERESVLKLLLAVDGGASAFRATERVATRVLHLGQVRAGRLH